MTNQKELKFDVISSEEKQKKGILPYLTLPLTNVCDRSCIFCGKGGELTKEGQPKFFPIDLLVDRVLTAIQAGVSKFRLTGGEPFLHPQIGDILKFFSDQNIYLLVNTNGSKVVDHSHDFIELRGNVHVAVSLHTPDEQTYNKIMRTKNQFVIVNQGIKYLAEVGNLLRLNMVVTGYNRDHIDDMINYCKEIGCGLKIHEIVAVPIPFMDRDVLVVPIEPIERKLAERAERVLPHEYSESFGIPCKRYVVNGVTINVKSLGHGSRFDLEGLCEGCKSYPCHEGLYDCYVLPDGNILPCRWGSAMENGRAFEDNLQEAIKMFQRAEYVPHPEIVK